MNLVTSVSFTAFWNHALSSFRFRIETRKNASTVRCLKHAVDRNHALRFNSQLLGVSTELTYELNRGRETDVESGGL